MSCTVVAFNAHPDDETLLMAGTLAALADRGHRILLVTATDGAQGLAAEEYTEDGGLGRRRLGELAASGRALGVSGVHHLGYAGSGSGGPVPDDPPGTQRLVRAPVEEAAGRLADLLRRESADVLISYDQAGGYGHRDHVVVHHVGRRAAELAGTTRLLEATVPREPLLRALRGIERVRPFPHGFRAADWAHAYTPGAEITDRVDVRAYLGAKRAAMRAHATQASGTADSGARTLAAVLKLPRPVYRAIFGREFFVDPAAPPGTRRTDPLEGLS